MLDAAFKSLSQMLSPPFRAVLLKSMALSAALLALVVIVLYRLLSWVTGSGLEWAESAIGPIAHTPLAVFGWLLAFALGLGLFAGAILLMPAVGALVASFFADEIAEQVERTRYPADPPGIAPPIWRAVFEGIKTALLALAVYLCAAPFLLLAGLGILIFFLANAYLLGREYFELAAMRLHPAAEAKALYRANRARVFVAGLFIAAFVLIPIVNLATPLFGTAFMVHMHKRIAGASRREAIEPRR